MSKSVFKNWLNSSYLTQSNHLYIDKIYRNFLKNPNSVDISWQDTFNRLFDESYSKDKSYTDLSTDSIYVSQSKRDLYLDKSYKKNQIGYDPSVIIKISQLINSFRTYGHQYAQLDPLDLNLNEFKNNFLELEYYKFIDQDLQRIFNTALFGMNNGLLSLQNIYKLLKKMYCGSVGIEYMHIPDIDKILWIQNYFESRFLKSDIFSNIEQKQFLEEVIAAESLEHYLGTRFPGVKRFSLEGCDVLVPVLKEIIRYSVINNNIKEIFIGMAHRGRLNVLVNVLGKNPQDLFNEFYNTNRICVGSGDVKYHQGLHSNIKISEYSDIVHLYLLFNPSHLEIITPVVMGSVRAKIDQLYHTKHTFQNNHNISNIVLPVVIHGDAAISAQGIVQESFNMSNTYAYNVKGTIHIIINNQIGFTTSNIYNIRSTPYCTDIAKMINAPIFHVNADDINSVIFITRFALDFRNQFNNDVLIDLVCYRRHGHNEADDPSVTQPIMYKKIHAHPTAITHYFNFLKKVGIVKNIDEITSIKRAYNVQLETQEHCLSGAWKPIKVYSTEYINNIDQYHQNNFHKKIQNQYLQELAYNISNIPSNISMHNRVKKIYDERVDMALGKRLFDWGASEVLAYATLLDQGYSIRLSGEDVARGTFFHRHAIIHDQSTGSTYIPLQHISKEQGLFFIWDSVLSEESALAFEYGYAHIASNTTLVIWEAQFGDFSNGAQIVIDQFISSSEQKWAQLCGLVMLLPHGYEGQGPEHSSCRIERYLQLCAEHNIRICIPSTPAQIFHILRQQAINNIRKPLIIVSPKSLLRHAMVTASIKDLVYGSFKTIFNENNTNCIVNKVNRVIICSGKVYYDLIQKRNQKQQYNIAIIRIEQLYPFPDEEIRVILQSYSHVKDFIWCQEEPKNQGAWHYIQRCFYKNKLITSLYYIGRLDSASPAVGYFSEHQKQQDQIINDALDLNFNNKKDKT